MKREKTPLLRNGAVQSLLASLLCVLIGLLVGYVVLLVINPAGAGEAIVTIVKNFMTYSKPSAQLKYLGSTLVKTAPLLMCSLSVLFAYKVGLFNIGAAGQYVVGAGASLYCALAWGMPWYVCLLAAIVAGAALGAISGLLKAYCNVNEVISCIMLNWISLYVVNMILTTVKETTSPYTVTISSTNPAALIPSLGLGKLFSNNQYVTIALPIALLVSILIWVVLEKTKFGYELRATGNNKNAAKYCGMNEKRNIILTMVIAGALAGLGAALLFLTGFEQWQCSQSSVPGMGFNGIAAAFLGGLKLFVAVVVRAHGFCRHARRFAKHLAELKNGCASNQVKSRLWVFDPGQVYGDTVVAFALDHRFGDAVLVYAGAEDHEKSFQTVRGERIFRRSLRLKYDMDAASKVKAKAYLPFYRERHRRGDYDNCNDQNKPPFVSF